MRDNFDIDNLQLKLAENHYLIKAFAENSLTDLQQFAVLRRARRRLIGDDLTQEMMIETRLGMAEYARLVAINEIDRAQFVDAAGAHMATLRNPQSLINEKDALSASTGCLLCLALKQLGINFDTPPHGTPLFDTIDFGKTPIEILFQ